QLKLNRSSSKDEYDSLGYLRHISRLKQRIKSQETEIKNLKKLNLKMEEKLEKAQQEASTLNEKIEDLHYQYSKGILAKKELTSKIAIIKRLQAKYQHEKELKQNLQENLNSIK